MRYENTRLPPVALCYYCYIMSHRLVREWIAPGIFSLQEPPFRSRSHLDSSSESSRGGGYETTMNSATSPRRSWICVTHRNKGASPSPGDLVQSLGKSSSKSSLQARGLTAMSLELSSSSQLDPDNVTPVPVVGGLSVTVPFHL
jgi:hypothetical protein